MRFLLGVTYLFPETKPYTDVIKLTKITRKFKRTTYIIFYIVDEFTNFSVE